MKIHLILSMLIFVLVLVAAGAGAFYTTPGEPYEFTSVRGERAIAQGSGLYRFDPVVLVREGVIWDTINLNKALQPDRIMCTIYMPFKGTPLGEKCLADGWLTHPVDDSEVYYTEVSIRHPTIPARTLLGYQGFFDYYVRLPKRLHWLVHFLRFLYQLLPAASHRLPPPLRIVREAVIACVYRMKRFLPSPGFFMKSR